MSLGGTEARLRREVGGGRREKVEVGGMGEMVKVGRRVGKWEGEGEGECCLYTKLRFSRGGRTFEDLDMAHGSGIWSAI